MIQSHLENSKKLDLIVVLAMTLVGIAIRIFGSHQRMFFLNEFLLFQGIVSNEGGHWISPMYLSLLQGLIRFWGGLDPFSMHLVHGAIAGLSIPGVFLLGRVLYGRTVGLIAAGLITLAPTSLMFGTMIGPYGLLQLVFVLALVGLVLAFRSNKPRYWVLYSFALLLLLQIQRGADLMLWSILAGIFLYIGLSIWRGKPLGADKDQLVYFFGLTMVFGYVGVNWFYQEDLAPYESLHCSRVAVAGVLEKLGAQVFFNGTQNGVSAVVYGFLALLGWVSARKETTISWIVISAAIIVPLLMLNGTRPSWCGERWLPIHGMILPLVIILMAKGVYELAGVLSDSYRKALVAVIILVSLSGWVDWYRSYSMDVRSNIYKDFAGFVRQTPAVRGVIIPNPALGDSRIGLAMAYALMVHDPALTLPLWLEKKGDFVPLRRVADQGLGPYLKEDLEQTLRFLPAGKYGVISHGGIATCPTLSTKFVTLSETSSLQLGGDKLLICMVAG